MPDYTTLLAESIARARPQIMGVGRGPVTIPPRMNIVERGSRETFGVDEAKAYETLAKLFGYVPTEDLVNQAKVLQTRLAERRGDPEAQQQLLDDPVTRSALRVLEKRGYPLTNLGIVTERIPRERAPVSGIGRLFRTIEPYYTRYRYSPTIAEKQLTAKQLGEIVGYGPTAAAELERIREASRLRPPEETEILAKGPSVAIPYIQAKAELERKKAEAAETQAQKNLLMAHSEAYKAQAQLYRIQEQLEKKKLEVEYSPEAITLERKRKLAEIKYHDSLAKKADSEAYQATQLGKAVLPKESMELWGQSQQIYKQGQNLFIQIATGLKLGERDAALRNLTSLTKAHIQAALNSFGRSGPASDAMTFWVGEMLPEVLIKIPKRGGFPITGWWATPDPETETRLRRYAKDAKEIIELAGSDPTVSATIRRQYLDLITEVCEKTTLTPTTVELAKWAIEYFSPIRDNPDIARDIERLINLISPKKTPSGVVERPLPAP